MLHNLLSYDNYFVINLRLSEPENSLVNAKNVPPHPTTFSPFCGKTKQRRVDVLPRSGLNKTDDKSSKMRPTKRKGWGGLFRVFVVFAEKRRYR